MDASKVLLLLDSDIESATSYSSENLQLMRVCTEDRKLEDDEKLVEESSGPDNLVSKLTLACS